MQTAMKNHVHTATKRRALSAFSLFEVLLFTAILGVMVGMVIPMIGQNDAAYAARDRRNAQELCSTCMMAQAAELNFVQGDSVIETVRAIVRGGMSVRGAMRGRIFVVPGLSNEDIQGAAKFLKLQDGQLLYTTSVTTSPPGDQRL